MAVDFGGLNFFMPIFSYFFVFILVYALLAKTEIIGSKGLQLFVSFILASFFIVNLSLVEFVEFSAAWFSVFIVCVFLILALVGFIHGKLDFIQGNPVVGWVLGIALVVFFIISSSYVFSWTFNYSTLWNWVYSEWFGFVLVLLIAGIVSWVLAKS
jgi:hypothetical protein